MPEATHTPALYSQNLQTKSQTYFFDVRQAKNGNKYMTITQSWIKDGQKFRNTLSLFANNLEEFNKAFAESQEQMK
jgi:hypothetical protein